jgi:hypothetical protein
VVDAATTVRRFEALSALVRSHPGADRYPGDASRARLQALSRTELERLADTDTIVAGFRVPERSISTTWVADRYVDALRAEPRIEQAMGTRVLGVRPTESAGRERWRLRTDTPIDGDFDAVVNALWAGRLAIDADVGLQPEPGWSHRYRVSLFVRTGCPVDARSLVVSTGPFGDIKNYNGRDFYLSWYPAGLLLESRDTLPAEPEPASTSARSAIIDAIRAGLGASIPQTHAILDNAESVQVQGGWVFAQGHGSLAYQASTLHRRDRFGIVRRGTYWSVDTGKYSTAPWLARQVAAGVCELGG